MNFLLRDTSLHHIPGPLGFAKVAGNMSMDEDKLSEGMTVEIVDLQRQPEMNGCRGICRQFDVNLRRWSIEVQ